MTRLHTSLVRSKHDYTRVKTPWIIDSGIMACGRLIKYISGGGMSTFGRTVRQEVVRRKQLRFLYVAAVIGVVWTLFLFV